MADHYRPRPTGDIIERPAFDNYEFSQLLSEPFSALQNIDPEYTTSELWEQLITGEDMFPNAPNDRFVVHERDLVLEEGPSEDPLESEDGYDSDEGSDLFEYGIDDVLQMRRDSRRNALIRANLRPEPRVIAQQRSRDMFRNTSLSMAEIPSSELPPQCRAQRAEETCFRGLPFAALQELIEEQREEKSREAALEAELDNLFGSLAHTKRDIETFKTKVQTAADEWCSKDSTSFGEWLKYVQMANKCSRSQNRCWQIATWYQKGVPDELLESVLQLAANLVDAATDTLRFKKIQVKLDTDGVEVPSCRLDTFCDDEYWNSAARKQLPGHYLMLGEDYAHDLPNGFSDYLGHDSRPKNGKSGHAVAQHITANLETRKVRVEHEPNAAKRTALRTGFFKFVTQAGKVVDDELHKLLGSEPDVSRPDTAEECLAIHEALKIVQRALFDAHLNIRLT